MEILAEVETGLPTMSLVLGIIGIILCSIFITSALFFVHDMATKNGWDIGGIVLSLLLISTGSVIFYFAANVEMKQGYEVIIHDYNEVYEQGYEIIDKRGEIYTIQKVDED